MPRNRNVLGDGCSMLNLNITASASWKIRGLRIDLSLRPVLSKLDGLKKDVYFETGNVSIVIPGMTLLKREVHEGSLLELRAEIIKKY